MSMHSDLAWLCISAPSTAWNRRGRGADLCVLTAVFASVAGAYHCGRVIQSFGEHLVRHFSGSQDSVAAAIRALLQHLGRDLPGGILPTFTNSAGAHFPDPLWIRLPLAAVAVSVSTDQTLRMLRGSGWRVLVVLWTPLGAVSFELIPFDSATATIASNGCLETCEPAHLLGANPARECHGCAGRVICAGHLCSLQQDP